uniref:DUF4129 domain-containing protein n=1 Tax=Caldisericum exile TaxID=693075 RepID=A0A7C4Y634_9BACT
MVYIIFVLELSLIILSFIFTALKTLYLVNILVVIVVGFMSLLLFLLFKFEIPLLPILLLTFILNPLLSNKLWYFNFLPFIALYFFLIERIKENEIFNSRFYFYLLPIIFMGFLSVNFLGILERSFISLMKSLLSSLLSPINSDYFPYKNIGTSNLVESVKRIINEGGGIEDYRISPIANFFAIAFSILVLVAFLSLFIKVVVAKSPSHYRTVRTWRFFVIVSFFYFILFIILFLTCNLLPNTFTVEGTKFNLIYFALLLLFYAVALFIFKIAHRTFEERIVLNEFVPKLQPVFFVLSLLLLLTFIIFVLKYNGANKDEIMHIFVLSFSFTGLATILLTMIREKGEFEIVSLPKALKESKEMVEHYRRYGSEYLNKIKEKREYIKFLYFLAIITFIKKGYPVEECLTPREILFKVRPCLSTNLFFILTDAFYTAEYSNEEIDDEIFNEIKAKSSALLKEINVLDEFKKTLETSL